MVLKAQVATQRLLLSGRFSHPLWAMASLQRPLIEQEFCSLTRGNLPGRHADWARLVDLSGKEGWRKLDEPHRRQVHLGQSGWTRCHKVGRPFRSNRIGQF